MNELIITAAGCVALGIMATMHPCPMTSNIAAISLISGWSGSKNRRLSIIIYFILGYMFSMMGMASLLNFSVLSAPKLSLFLQNILSAFLGPLLIIIGMVLSNMINLNRFYSGYMVNRIDWKNKSGLYAFPFGSILALTFCPATASIYFGILIPLSVKSNQVILYPLLYATGAALPIVAVSIFINRGLVRILQVRWTKKIPSVAGWLLIIIGIYITIEQLYIG